MSKPDTTWTPAQRDYLARMMKTIATGTGTTVRERINKMVEESQASIDEAFEAVKGYIDRTADTIYEKINELESNTWDDAGTWNADTAYRKNHGTTHAGSYWIAQRATQPGEKPGAGNCWRLAVKAGRDAR